MSLNEYGNRALDNQRAHGFSTPDTLHNSALVLAKLMLIVTELSEAAEAARDNDLAHFEEEMADVLIRSLGMMSGLGLDIDGAVQTKMKYNESRPFQHGRASPV